MLRSLVRTTLALALLLPQAARAADPDRKTTADATKLSDLGDQRFRQSRFEEAEAAYKQALEMDPSSVAGHLGMGKMATMLSDRAAAARHYSAAYQRDPRNPDAILAFSTVVEDRSARLVLMRNYLALTPSLTSQQAREVAAQLRIEEHLGARKPSSLQSAYRPYQISLANLRNEGLLLHARINGGRELKLILDTGATGVVLNASVGDTHLEFLSASALAGFGTAAPSRARLGLADRFSAGDVEISNLMVDVSEADITPDADGIIGLDVFQNFLIRIDPRGRKLHLLPREEAAPCEGCTRAYRLGHLLLLRGRINGANEGYFILDTGSPFTLISQSLMPQTGRPSLAVGAQGSQEIAVPSTPVTLQLGDRHLWGFEYATLDTGPISTSNGTAIAGAIGYSLLRDLSLTVDYRAGLVKLEKTKPEKPSRP